MNQFVQAGFLFRFEQSERKDNSFSELFERLPDEIIKNHPTWLTLTKRRSIENKLIFPGYSPNYPHEDTGYKGDARAELLVNPPKEAHCDEARYRRDGGAPHPPY
jgi:hypothetical protein